MKSEGLVNGTKLTIAEVITRNKTILFLFITSTNVYFVYFILMVFISIFNQSHSQRHISSTASIDINPVCIYKIDAVDDMCLIDINSG